MRDDLSDDLSDDLNLTQNYDRLLLQQEIVILLAKSGFVEQVRIFRPDRVFILRLNAAFHIIVESTIVDGEVPVDSGPIRIYGQIGPEASPVRVSMASVEKTGTLSSILKDVTHVLSQTHSYMITLTPADQSAEHVVSTIQA